ncbi:hypothetical protein D3C71_1549830 [compost metagenome]
MRRQPLFPTQAWAAAGVAGRVRWRRPQVTRPGQTERAVASCKWPSRLVSGRVVETGACIAQSARLVLPAGCATMALSCSRRLPCYALSLLRCQRHQGHRFAPGRRGRASAPSARMPGLRGAFHHLRNRRAGDAAADQAGRQPPAVRRRQTACRHAARPGETPGEHRASGGGDCPYQAPAARHRRARDQVAGAR